MKISSTRPQCNRPGRSAGAVFRRALAGAGFGIAVTSALPAAAQWYGRPEYGAPVEPYGYDRPAPVFRGDSRPLPPFSIVERLEGQGYEDITRPRYNGSVYELDATSPRGNRVRLVIDAFRGNVVERSALGRADDGDGGREQRGWFGNNVRPPEEGSPRRYTARPSDDDDGPDTFERLARPPGARPVPAPSRVETEPLPAAPHNTARLPAEGRPRETPTARAPSPDRQASRSDLSLPKPEASNGTPKVEGVNPAAKPASRATAPNERASKPDTNRAFDTARTDPSATPKPVTTPRPVAPTPTASPAKAAPVAETPTVPAPIVSQATPAETPAVTADTSRPNKPVRVIQGVTPVYPEGNGAKPQ